jgi:hypothetical protein
MSIEAQLIAWLPSQLPGVRFLTETPADLQTVVPVVRVVRTGGVADENAARFAAPVVTFECYANGYGAAADLADRLDAAILTKLRGQTLAGSVVTKARQVSGPTHAPYPDTLLREFVTAHELHVIAPPS